MKDQLFTHPYWYENWLNRIIPHVEYNPYPRGYFDLDGINNMYLGVHNKNIITFVYYWNIIRKLDL